MNRILTRLGGALPALALLVVQVAGAEPEPLKTNYTIKSIAQIGGKVGATQLPSGSDYRFFVGPMADNGRFTFGIGPSLANRFYQGSYSTGKADWLCQYSAGTSSKITPIVLPGAAGPGGNWPADVSILWPVSMNQEGNVAFSATTKGSTVLGTFVWDAGERNTIPVVQQGMPAPDGGRSLTFRHAGSFGTAINNSNEIAFAAWVTDPAGPDGPGVFFTGRDGKMVPILLPGQTLGGQRLYGSLFARPTIKDDGTVAFLARRQGDSQLSAFRWQSGSLTPMALRGGSVPGGTIRAVTGVWLNDRDDRALITADVTPTDGSGLKRGLYRWVDGALLPLMVYGQPTPDGGKFRSLQNVHQTTTFLSTYDYSTLCFAVSEGNRYGEHVLLANLEDGSSAAYRVDVAGNIRPILRSGTVTPLGTITRVGVDSPASMNSYLQQVAMSVRINNGPPTLVVLSPDN
jgi:hypothetical protein